MLECLWNVQHFFHKILIMSNHVIQFLDKILWYHLFDSIKKNTHYVKFLTWEKIIHILRQITGRLADIKY